MCCTTCVCVYFYFSNYFLTPKPYSFWLLASPFSKITSRLFIHCLLAYEFCLSLFFLYIRPYWQPSLELSSPDICDTNHPGTLAPISFRDVTSLLYFQFPLMGISVSSPAQTYCFASLTACWILLPSNDNSNERSYDIIWSWSFPSKPNL